MIIHITSAGETAETISNEYGVPEFIVRYLNNLENGLEPVEGQAILILNPLRYHTVQPEDTVYSIARQYGISVNALYRNNPILGGDGLVYPGQTLVVEFEKDRVGSIDVNGYAYPYIDRSLLKPTLPYINFMTPFTYGITESGGLVDLDDRELIGLAFDYGMLPLMHLSTLTEAGNFSNELASLVLNDAEIQNRLIEQIIETMSEKDYRGLDVDFEFVYPEDSLLYAEFIDRLRQTLNPLGYEVIAALAPKTSDEQTGLLYEGHNYQAIGDAANSVLLMTYEWGYTYGPAYVKYSTTIKTRKNVIF